MQRSEYRMDGQQYEAGSVGGIRLCEDVVVTTAQPLQYAGTYPSIRPHLQVDSSGTCNFVACQLF